jgi:hypothetical protein
MFRRRVFISDGRRRSRGIRFLHATPEQVISRRASRRETLACRAGQSDPEQSPFRFNRKGDAKKPAFPPYHFDIDKLSQRFDIE